MGIKRQWKVDFHYDGTKDYGDPMDPNRVEGAYTIDTSRPINARSSHNDEASAHDAARTVSRNGGTATVSHRDSVTGEERVVREYSSYEVAMEELSLSEEG